MTHLDPSSPHGTKPRRTRWALRAHTRGRPPGSRVPEIDHGPEEATMAEETTPPPTVPRPSEPVPVEAEVNDLDPKATAPRTAEKGPTKAGKKRLPRKKPTPRSPGRAEESWRLRPRGQDPKEVRTRWGTVHVEFSEADHSLKSGESLIIPKDEWHQITADPDFKAVHIMPKEIRFKFSS